LVEEETKMEPVAEADGIDRPFHARGGEAGTSAMSPPAGGKRNMLDDQDWGAFKRKLKAKTEIDLDLYKEPQMKRRIGSLVTRKGYDSYTKYFDMATQDKTEFDAFIEYLTINVSEFFRTPEKFSKLETDVIPDLLTRSPKLNIWSAGCSIGAEPYSLAMILKEMTPGKQHRILATDLDIEILAKAKKGVYMENEIKSLSPERRKKYFDALPDNKFAVKEDIKRCIEFKRHNLLKDPFEKGFDSNRQSPFSLL